MWRNLVLMIGALAIAGLLSAAMSASARTTTLEFQLVTKRLDSQTLKAPNMENQTITQARAFGVGVFKDGRIAVKDFVLVLDLDNGVGSVFGYSTYTFDDGSSVTARFDGTVNSNTSHGEYKIISGTGAYSGASGTGTFDRIPSKFDVGVYKVKLNIVTP